MSRAQDRDGKSKTASAVDDKHYPAPQAPPADETSQTAKTGLVSADKQEKEAVEKSKSLLEQVNKQSGSVQR